MAHTNIVDIEFGQSYTQSKSWTTGPVSADKNAPSAGFRFINETSAAAAVVYRKIMGQVSPIYFSANAPLPPGTEDLTPINKVAIWFSNTAVTSTMISNFQGTSQEIDFTGRKNALVKYAVDGTWSLS